MARGARTERQEITLARIASPSGVSHSLEQVGGARGEEDHKTMTSHPMSFSHAFSHAKAAPVTEKAREVGPPHTHTNDSSIPATQNREDTKELRTNRYCVYLGHSTLKTMAVGRLGAVAGTVDPLDAVAMLQNCGGR